MRKDMHEPADGMFKSTTSERLGGRTGDAAKRPGALNAPAVDEALADDALLADSLPAGSLRGSRRELTSPTADVERRIIDYPHMGRPATPTEAPGDGMLLRRLAQQLSSLQAQQDQIRRLLEQAEDKRGRNSFS